MPQARHALTAELASRFAQLALANAAREYPNKLDHVLAGPDDLAGPRQLDLRGARSDLKLELAP